MNNEYPFRARNHCHEVTAKSHNPTLSTGSRQEGKIVLARGDYDMAVALELGLCIISRAQR